jgi:hypothetical protein
MVIDLRNIMTKSLTETVIGIAIIIISGISPGG